MRSARRTAAAIPSLPTSCWKALTSGRTAATPTRPWTPIASHPHLGAQRGPLRGARLDPDGEQHLGGARLVPAAVFLGRAQLRVVAAQRPDPSHQSRESAPSCILGQHDERRRVEHLVERDPRGQAGDPQADQASEHPGVVEADSPRGLPQPLGGGGALAPVGDPHRGLGEPVIELRLHWGRAVAQCTHIVLIDALDHTARSSKTPSTPIRFPAPARARETRSERTGTFSRASQGCQAAA